MAFTTINKSTDYLDIKLWSSVDTSITGLNFQPDWAWIKSRTNADTHVIFDAVRGANKRLISSANLAESTTSDELTAFNSDGYTLGTGDNVNRSGHNYVSWNWKANGVGSSNTDGSINTTYTSVNTTAGFSISTYTGTGSSATIGHGLGASPDVVIIKKTSAAEDWNFQTSAIGYGNYLVLNSSGASSSAGGGLVSAVSSTTVTVDSNSYVNSSGATYVMYAFAEKTGYSKFGKYTGNGNADGAFVYTGFKPSFVLIKSTNTGENWFICDNKREGYNAENNRLIPNLDAVEQSDSPIDILSNGFKARETSSKVNGSGEPYIYMAFGQSLVGSNNVPCTAR